MAGGILAQQVRHTVLFVVGNASSPATGDASIKTYLEGLGYTVTYLDDDSVTGSETGYDCVLVSDSVNHVTISSYLTFSTMPVITLEYLSWKNHKLATDATEDASQTNMDLILDTHPIAGTLSNGAISIFSSAATIRNTKNTSVLGSGATVIFESPVGSGRACIFTYENGTTLAGTPYVTALARRVALPFEYGQWSNLTTTAKEIFARSVQWAMGVI